LDVDVGLVERGRAVEAGRIVAQRDLDQHGFDLADDLLDWIAFACLRWLLDLYLFLRVLRASAFHSKNGSSMPSVGL
jgi:hypothetical protein